MDFIEFRRAKLKIKKWHFKYFLNKFNKLVKM